MLSFNKKQQNATFCFLARPILGRPILGRKGKELAHTVWIRPGVDRTYTESFFF